jgi:hypothetical protein
MPGAFFGAVVLAVLSLSFDFNSFFFNCFLTDNAYASHKRAPNHDNDLAACSWDVTTLFPDAAATLRRLGRQQEGNDRDCGGGDQTTTMAVSW